MTVYKGLGDYLLAETSIAALVGSRLFKGMLPQKVDLTSGKAALVLIYVDGPSTYHLKGPNAQVKARWQIDCWAQTADVAAQLGKLSRWRLSGFAGIWTDNASPGASITVQLIGHADEGDTPEPEISGGLFRTHQDYFITYSSSEDMVLI